MNESYTNQKFGGGFAASGGVQIGGQLIDNSINVSSDNAEKVAQLIIHLRELAQSFPEAQQEEIGFGLKDLERDQQSGTIEPKQIQRRLKGFLAAATAAFVSVVPVSEGFKTVSSNAVGTVDNVKILVEEAKRFQGNQTQFEALPESDQQLVKTVEVFAERVGKLAEVLEAAP